MTRRPMRFDIFWILIPVIIFWGFDVYVITCGIPAHIINEYDYWSIQLRLFGMLLVLLILPFYFYYRLRKNEVSNRRIGSLYFPFSLLMIILLVLSVKVALAAFFFGIYTFIPMKPELMDDGGLLNKISFGSLLVYVLLQIAFSIDTVRMIKATRKRRLEILDKLGDP